MIVLSEWIENKTFNSAPYTKVHVHVAILFVTSWKWKVLGNYNCKDIQKKYIMQFDLRKKNEK